MFRLPLFTSQYGDKHIVTSRQPLAALEPAKLLAHSVCSARLWLRETKTVWVVQRHEGGKMERRGAGRESVCCAASDSVCCVWTSDRVIGRRRKGVVYLGARY